MLIRIDVQDVDLIGPRLKSIYVPIMEIGQMNKSKTNPEALASLHLFIPLTLNHL